MQSWYTFSVESAVFGERNLVSAAGLVPVRELAEQTGLSRLIGEHVELPSARVASGAVNPSLSIRYRDSGTGAPLVFVHGVYVTGALWDDVVDKLSPQFRCITPTWPFGAQGSPVGPADLTVRAAGRRIAGLLEALDLSDVTLVANDTGGGVVLSALGDSGLDLGRVSRLVFTNCGSYEHFPPSSFKPLVKLCSVSVTAGAFMLRALASGPGLRFFASSVTTNGIPSERYPAIFGGFATSAAVRREAARFTADLNSRYTLEAAAAIPAWRKPVLLAWGD
ncbi:MAG TPA: alpha/beta fold hydrolase, partial [Mycobacterium sp.]|nr:alpha/beta fold hydrolase [Mycobacterium sp.]